MDKQISCVPDSRFKSNCVFNRINKQFITLNADDKKIYSNHLHKVVESFKDHMKRVDPLFNEFFSRIVYTGSYYEKLKVQKPEEFDLDFVIKLPVNYESSFTHTVAPEQSGYIKIQVSSTAMEKLKENKMWKEEKRMKKWFNPQNYLDQNAFREWFESVLNKAFSSLTLSASTTKKYVMNVDKVEYTLTMRKSGPAFTLLIEIPRINAKIDVDLVPVLEFNTSLPKPFRSITVQKKNWFAVSKPLIGAQNGNLLWRPSFYEQEQCILKGPIKQVIRQMKKFRDTQGFYSIVSYYIKTLFLWELDEQNPQLQQEKNWDGNFQKIPSTYLFFYMLHKLRDACKNRRLNDYWNSNNNLFIRINPQSSENIYGRIKKIIETIDKQIAFDKFIIAFYILEKDEFDELTKSSDTNGVLCQCMSPVMQGECSESHQPENSSTSSLDTASSSSNDLSIWQTIATAGAILAAAGIMAYQSHRNNRN